MAVARSRSIDTPPRGSVFWRPSDPSIARSGDSAEERLGGVSAGSDAPLLGRRNRNPGRVAQGYPIQLAKVQRPPLRAATLRRERLTKWLDEHAGRRVIFVSAEAGYGKTTLLADWARYARMRVLWYRMDEEDGNWVTFARYLVAAGREFDPAFAPRTSELLDAHPGEVTHQAVAAELVAELPSLGGVGRVVFVLDDYHLVDHVPEIQELMKLVIARALSGMSFILAGRRSPSVPVSRLRTMGKVAELRNEDLRFQLGETSELFRETYGKHLEADVIEDVNRRTEGWAASLQLVSAAVRDRSPAETRTFVRGLTGAKGDLYDYLAEEVVGDLDPDIRAFLMRTSILQVVDQELASFVTGLPADEVARLISTTETLGLLGRRGQHEPEGHRYHPLVREFLEARFHAEDGADAVVSAHRKVATATEELDWRVAAHHYAAVGDTEDLHRLMVSSVAAIMATGEFASAATYAGRLHPSAASPVFDLFISRLELDEGRTDSALSRALSSYLQLTAARDGLRHLALSNLASINLALGHLERAYELFTQLIASDAPAEQREIGRATLAMLDASTNGPLDDYQFALSEMEVRQRRDGETHYLAITLLNSGVVAQTRGDAKTAANKSGEAIALLQSGSRGGELTTAVINHAWALAHSGHWDDAQNQVLAALAEAEGLALAEGLVEAADLWTWYGDQATATRLAAQALELRPGARLVRESLPLTQVELHCRNGDLEAARRVLDSMPEVRMSTTLGQAAGLEPTDDLSAGHSPVAGGVAGFLEEVRVGWRFLRGETVLLVNTLQAVVGQFTLGVLLTLTPFYARDVLVRGTFDATAAYAFLETGIGVGNLVGGLAIGLIGARLAKGHMVISGYALWGLCTMLLAVTGNLGLALGLMVGSGVANMVYVIPSQTLFQERTPANLIGRVVGFRFSLVFGSMTLAMAISGVLAAQFGVPAVIGFFGLITLGAGLAGLLVPAVRDA